MIAKLKNIFKNDSQIEALKTQTIILSAEISFQINSLNIFKHNKDGLRLWEAGIILSRFVLNNKEEFKGKSVIELGAGVGLASIVVDKQC